MAKDTLRKSSDVQVGGGVDASRDGTSTGSASKGYAEHACDGSDYTKFGNRIDYSKLAATSFK
jgi:hypothetical protein